MPLLSSEARSIIVELSSGSETHIGRCCERPRPVSMGVSFSHNTALTSCIVKCVSCKSELVVLRWKEPKRREGEPAGGSTAADVSMLDGDPALD